MTFDVPLKELLSDKYDPTNDSPLRFQEAYDQLVKHRDHLREKYNTKEQRARISSRHKAGHSTERSCLRNLS